MKMQFKVTYDDGREVEAVAGPRDFVAFERQFGRALPTDEKDLRLEYMYYLAWSPLHRAGVEQGDFDTFLGAVDEIGSADAPADAADPSQAEPSPAASST